MEQIQTYLNAVFLDNPLKNYFWFALIIIAGFSLKKVISKLAAKIIFRFLHRFSKAVSFEKLYILLKKPFRFFIIVLTFYFAFDRLQFPQNWQLVSKEIFGIRMLIFGVFETGIIISITWVTLRIIDFLGLELLHRTAQKGSKSDDQLVPFFKEAAKIIVVIFCIFFMLGTIFKVNVASLIAGLGIGGLAVALAAKESIENLLGSFTIFLDKPFVIGDLIQVGDINGTVEKIGFRSTRIRTIEKSYLTVPNKKLVESELDNLSLRTFRRANFNIGLVYETKANQIKSIVKEIQELLDSHPHTNQDGRVKFHGFGDSSLDVMVVYYVDTIEWDVYLDVREEINYKIMEIVEANNSGFAFPSQTVYMAPKK
ncbi:MAG: mechanosensitive ion channel family protein [Bacteroidia bacterium]